MPRNDKRFEMAPRYVAGRGPKVTSHSVSRAGIIAGRVLNPKGVPFSEKEGDAQRGMTWRSGGCVAIFSVCAPIEGMACVNFE